MTTDIFIVTYAPDAVWLEYCLRSIDKYARGFRRTVVVYPVGDQFVLAPVCGAHPRVVQVTFEPGSDGHLDQNILKTEADLHTDADFILHVDSDCVFTAPASPADFMTDGRPDLWWENYAALQKAHAGGPVPWQAITSRALGFYVDVETMRRFPMLYPRALYAATRRQIESMNGKPFREYVRTATCIGGAFHGYSEFNALGCIGYYQLSELFCVRHISSGREKPEKLRQYWSHLIRAHPDKFEQQVRPELEQITEKFNAQHAAA